MSISSFITRVCTPRNQRHFLEYQPHLEKISDTTFLYKKEKQICSQALEELSALFNNKGVYLIGSGPSINEQNLSLIQQQPIVLLNGAISLIESKQIKPTAFMVVDKSFIRNHPETLKLIPANTPCIFAIGVIKNILDIDPDFFDTHPLYFVEKATKRYQQAAITSSQLPEEFFAKNGDVACTQNISKGFAEGGTVMYVAAQLMLSLQAKQITLVGFDLGNADKPRFYETQKNSVKSGLKKAIEKRIIPSFTLLAKLCKQHGIKLTNASHLSSMPYGIIPFDNILMPERDKPDHEQ